MSRGHSTAINVLSLLGVAGALAYCGSSSDNSVFPPGNASGGLSTGTGSSTGSGAGTGIIVPATGTGTSTGTGIGAGTGTGGVTSDAACAAQASDSSALPSDIFIMLDKSGSMNCPAADDACETPPRTIVHPTRWEAVTTAINGFVAAPGSAGIGVGIGFFAASGNNNAACNVASYATPTVAIAPLPGSSMGITNAIAANMPTSNTPTVPALTGAIQYATQYTMNTPGRAASVVFVTDGLPNGCNSTIPAATMVATAGYMGMPQVKTYVIGLGATASLDQIALAGSGGATHYFPATGDVAAQLAAALTKISGQVSCDYTIPVNGTVNPKSVNVQISLGGAAPQLLGYVGTAAMCGSGGWYYDNADKPTKITLCQQSCDPLKNTMNSKVQVLYGCQTQGPGIN